tara:strand:- start:421 stop:570 length:150 start_codon:yes stop_codon:yes gene_type:complete
MIEGMEEIKHQLKLDILKVLEKIQDCELNIKSESAREWLANKLLEGIAK